MDFSLGSIGGSGFNSNGSSAGDRSLTSITENRQQRMLGSPSSNDFLLSNSCRSATEVDLDSRDDQILPSLKLARTDSSRWQPELKMSAPAGLLIRHSPMQFDSRMPYSPTSSRVSDDALLCGDSRFVAESRLLRGDSLVSSASAFLGSPSPSLRHPPSYQESYVQHRPAGIPVLLGREAAAMLHAGMHDAAVAVGGRCLFTAAQWAELEHQALIYKYIMHGSPVPAELLHPIRRSVAAMSGIPHNLISGGWGGFQLGSASNVDPEPGRCRRTDGKKWRCARPVVPEQKYCERHMHRGRHRRKAAEAQNNSSTQAAGGPPSSTAIVGAITGRESNLSPGLAQANHSLKSTMAFNPQQPMLTKSLSSLAATPGNALATTSAGSVACNQFSLPLHALTGLSTNKDSRFLSHGINRAHFDLRPEQLLSDFSGSSRGLDPSKVSALPSDQQLVQWHLQQSKMTPFGLRSSCGSFLQQHCDQIKFLNAQEMVTVAEANRLNQLLRQQQQHMHYVDNRNVSMKTFTGDSKSENQPLRHFFDDWPRTGDASTLSWPDADDEKLKANGSSTQLSISITTASSSDISANDSPTRAKTIFSPLKLSMLRNGEDMADPPTYMGLGINLNHRKSSWFPTALETSVGGPLGEVLQSSTPHPVQKEGLNVLREDWDAHSQDAPQNTSPTGVLQKPTLGCFSDSSSNASSPGSVRTEHAISENHKVPALMNAPSRLAT